MSYSDSYSADEGIAIIGMAGRFPGARNVRELWHNLVEGRETISHFRPHDLEPSTPLEGSLLLTSGSFQALIRPLTVGGLRAKALH